MRLILTWLISAIAIFLSAWLAPGATISSFGAALLVAIVLGAVNSFIRPAVLFLTLPINILTMGLFTLIVNTAMVSFVAFIMPGFSLAGFWTAFIFAIILSAVTWLIEGLLKEVRRS